MGYFVQAVTFALCWVFAKGIIGVLDLIRTGGPGQGDWGWAFMISLPLYCVAAIAAQIYIVRPYREHQREQPWNKGN